MLLSRMRRILAQALSPDSSAKLSDVSQELATLGLTLMRLAFKDSATLIPPRQLLSLPRHKAESLSRERVRPLYLGDHRAVSTILARYKFFTDTRDVGFATHILTDGFWEMSLTRLMTKTIKEGMFVLDVGANFGYYSVLMADLIGPSGKLIAFEPNPIAAASAEASLNVNGFSSRSIVLRSAVSNTSGTATFSTPYNEPKNARLVPAGYISPDAEIIQVPTVTIDEICCNERKVDFIKVDAEGGEYQIYQGMEKIIRRDRPMIVLEFNAVREGAAALMDLILETHGTLKYLGSDGALHDVTSERIMSENVGEDWLLFLH
ncbi:FkbM family methyltransferase [Microvirga yunnanensis]|uniref:FkbM family methyltransferase n=1 Tax=Microvirga yunnanensis TaxID=2953740 RepID=UPI0021C6D26F|nr:FkbM family methyltransferase [Microvirga sp. HBU65207]